MADHLYDRLLRDLLTAKNADENYQTAKQRLWEVVTADAERHLTMFFHNWFNHHWTKEHPPMKPYSPRARTTEQVKERRKADANLRGLQLMNMFLLDGETRLKDATGKQIRTEAGWLQLIAKHVKPHETVGRVLTAQQLFNLKIQAEPKGSKAA